MKNLYLANNDAGNIRITYNKLRENYSVSSSWWQRSEEIYKNHNPKNIHAICRRIDIEHFKIHVIIAVQSNKSFKEIYAKI